MESDFQSVIALILGLFVALAMVIRNAQLRLLPGSRWLIAAFSTLLAGQLWCWIATTTSNAPSLMLEHACYALSIVMIARWIWRYPPWRESGS
jgi:hypothetical protein